MNHTEFLKTYSNKHYLCLECGQYVSATYLSRHLLGHNLTLKSYYDKYVQIERNCSRDGCSNDRRFSGRLYLGYNGCCSKKCQSSVHSRNLWNSDDGTMKSAVSRNGKIAGSVNGSKNITKCHIKQFGSREAYVYLARVNVSVVKIGVAISDQRPSKFGQIISVTGRMDAKLAIQLEQKLLDNTIHHKAISESGEGSTEMRLNDILNDELVIDTFKL